MKRREEEICAVHTGLLRSLDLEVLEVRIMNWAAMYHGNLLTNMVVANPDESGTQPGCSESREHCQCLTRQEWKAPTIAMREDDQSQPLTDCRCCGQENPLSQSF